VALQPAQPALVEPLRGEQQVDAQAAAQPAHRDEQVEEVGPAGQQLAELVDDEQQGRQRRQLRAGPSAVAVGVHRVEVAGAPEELLATAELAVQRGLHPVDQSEVVGQVGDQPSDMG